MSKLVWVRNLASKTDTVEGDLAKDKGDQVKDEGDHEIIRIIKQSSNTEKLSKLIPMRAAHYLVRSPSPNATISSSEANYHGTIAR